MRRGFVRCLWGTTGVKLFRRRKKVVFGDIEFIKYNKFENPFLIYVFGEDNLKILNDAGYTNCKLLSKEPSLWNCKKDNIQQYGHKLKVLQEAAKDFDEFIFLDWDSLPIKPLPVDFWDVMSKKQPLQAHLRRYGNKDKWIKSRGAIWRDKNVNLRPCASFVYIRGQEIANKIYELWEKDKSWADEKTLAKITDDITGGWQGVNKYWDMFEPYSFTLFRDAGNCIAYPQSLLVQKDLCFLHVNRILVGYALRSIEGLKTFEEKQSAVGKILADRVSANLRGIGKI